MNKAELIEQLRNQATASATRERARGFWYAMSLAEELGEPPAMAWQGSEPAGTADIRAYVEGLGDVVATLYRERESTPWCIEFMRTTPTTVATEVVWQSLSGRRWCPIPVPPPLPQRGDA